MSPLTPKRLPKGATIASSLARMALAPAPTAPGDPTRWRCRLCHAEGPEPSAIAHTAACPLSRIRGALPPMRNPNEAEIATVSLGVYNDRYFDPPSLRGTTYDAIYAAKGRTEREAAEAAVALARENGWEFPQPALAGLGTTPIQHVPEEPCHYYFVLCLRRPLAQQGSERKDPLE